MAVTSVVLAGIEVNDSSSYYVGHDTLIALESGLPRDPRLVDMAGRHPEYVGVITHERAFPLIIGFRANTDTQRRTDYQTLLTAIETDALVQLDWTINSVTKTLMIFCGQPVLSSWFERVTISAVAPDPVAT